MRSSRGRGSAGAADQHVAIGWLLLAACSALLPMQAGTAEIPITLPVLEGPLENSATSHTWNGALWQRVPIDLSAFDYVEEEYYITGRARVYDWVPGSDFDLRVLDSASRTWLSYDDIDRVAATAYTTRIVLRRPQSLRQFSGRVVVEIINMTAGYDWTAIWGSLWEQILQQGDVYIGITSKPNVFPGMVRFDPARYARLSMPNPLPAEAQACGHLPGDPDFDPNLSRSAENGLAWDMFTQLGALLKSNTAENPLGQAAKRIYLAGESQSGSYLRRYFSWFHQRSKMPDGKPVYDGYFAEAGGTGTAMAVGLNQCAMQVNPLPADDPQRSIPGRGVPYFVVHSEWDFPLSSWPPNNFPASKRRPNANTAQDKFMLWELAGASHGWTWQYDYSDAAPQDVAAAGYETYRFVCGSKQPEVNLYMVEKAAYVLLDRWVVSGVAPPAADYIQTDFPDNLQEPLRDHFGNAVGGLRMPEIAVPIAGYRGGYVPAADCLDTIRPFNSETLEQLYPQPGDYLEKYTRATRDLVSAGFLLQEDAAKLIDAAEQRRIP